MVNTNCSTNLTLCATTQTNIILSRTRNNDSFTKISLIEEIMWQRAEKMKTSANCIEALDCSKQADTYCNAGSTNLLDLTV